MLGDHGMAQSSLGKDDGGFNGLYLCREKWPSPVSCSWRISRWIAFLPSGIGAIGIDEHGE